MRGDSAMHNKLKKKVKNIIYQTCGSSLILISFFKVIYVR